MTFGMLGCGLWVVGNLWQYLRGPSYGSGGFNLKERLTKHLLIDLFVLFGLGVVNFAYPDFALSFIVSILFDLCLSVCPYLIMLAGEMCQTQGL